jgi:3-phosphoshikimate 1-carboxyvinyltransferase
MTAAIVRSVGLEVEEFPDGLAIVGRPELLQHWSADRHGEHQWKGSGDHRIAMTGALFELLATGKFDLPDKSAVETSFPGFDELVQSIVRP